MRSQILSGNILSCHDVSDGGLIVALAEMAMAGQIGCVIDAKPNHAASFWFGEDQARYIIATDSPDQILESARAAGVPKN